MTDLPALGVYVHWPYCARICPYCDFNVVRDRKQPEQAALAAAIVADLEALRARSGPRRGFPKRFRPAGLHRAATVFYAHSVTQANTAPQHAAYR